MYTGCSDYWLTVSDRQLSWLSFHKPLRTLIASHGVRYLNPCMYLHVCVMCVCVCLRWRGLTCPAPVSAGPTALALGSVWSLRAKAELSETWGHRLMTQPAQMTERNESEDHGYNREQLSNPDETLNSSHAHIQMLNRELLSAGDVSADDETTAALPICCSMSCKLLRPVESNP